MSKTTKTILWLAIAVIIIGGIWYGVSKKSAPTVSTSITAKEPIKIGAILPLSGVAKYYGEMARQGISLAIDEINTKGSINSRKLEVIYEDSESNPSKGVSSFYKLVDINNVDLIISTLSSVSVPLAPLAKEKKVPVLAIMTTARNYMQNNYTFRYQPMTEMEVAPILWLFNNDLKNLTKIGILYLNDEFGKDVDSYLETELKKKNKEVFTESFLVTEKDFKTQILKLEKNKVDAIYAVGYGPHLQNIVRNLREMEFKGKILLANPVTTPTIRNNLGNSLNGVYVATPIIYCKGHNPSKIEQRFRNLAISKNYVVNQFNSMAYDGIYIIKNSLEGKKITSRENLRKTLEDVPSFTGILGKVIKKDNGHELAFKLYAGIISNNKVKCLNLEK